MRMIGRLSSEAGARVFSEYLYAQGIDNQVEPEQDGRWAVWIHAEEQIGGAEVLLKQYWDNPADPKYAGAAKDARDRRLRQQKEDDAARKRVHDASRLFPGGISGVGLLTAILIGISVTVSLVSGFGANRKPILWMYIS